MLYKLLHNRVYLGHIIHKEKSYPGQHEAIIDQAQWDAVHAILAANNRQRQSETWQRRPPESRLLDLFFPGGHFKFLHLWPGQIPPVGNDRTGGFCSLAEPFARRLAASLSR